MMQNRRKIRICAFLLALNLIFIWGNSLLPAELSQSLSDWVAEILPDQAAEAVEPIEGDVNILRKIAHFAEFTVLGFLLSWLMKLLQKKRNLALLFGTLAACVDETIQIFVPGRGPGWKDVLIDAGGVAAGMILLCLGNAIVRKIQNTKYGG